MRRLYIYSCLGGATLRVERVERVFTGFDKKKREQKQNSKSKDKKKKEEFQLQEFLDLINKAEA